MTQPLIVSRVNTEDGPVVGSVVQTENGLYYKFQNIPYAKPPLGNLRFMPPLPITPWTQEKDCTQDSIIAISWGLHYEIIGSEDCLHVDVSSPNTQPDEPMPVMFWIGSCGFTCNMDSLYDTSFINNQNIVFVRCSFRLGVFGFLSTNDFTAPGNCGLKDVVQGLKWVQRNIHCFGGDPSNVTIFGNSSGGAIVHFLMLSPMAVGLFHKAIIQSASALNSWSLAKNPIQPVMQLAKLLGIKTTCKIEIIDELRTLPAVDIMNACEKMEKALSECVDNNVVEASFKPCVEDEYEGQSAFLTKSPVLLIKSGNFNKVPFIIGSNNAEGAVLEYLKNDYYKFEKYNKNLNLLVPRSLAGDTPTAKSVGQQLLKFYLGGEEQLREDTRAQYLQLISDFNFLYYVNKTIALHSEYAPDCPIYYYILNYAGEWSVPKDLIFFNSLGHCAEIPFVFGIKYEKYLYKGSKDSITTRNRVIKMWTNFAKYGNPTPDDNDPLLQITWDPVDNSERLNYLSIGSELTKGRNPFQERMKFCDKLHKDHKFLRAQVYFNDMGVIL